MRECLSARVVEPITGSLIVAFIFFFMLAIIYFGYRVVKAGPDAQNRAAREAAEELYKNQVRRLRLAQEKKGPKKKPKPKLSEYNRYMKKELKALRKKHPRMKQSALMKKAAASWRRKKKEVAPAPKPAPKPSPPEPNICIDCGKERVSHYHRDWEICDRCFDSYYDDN